MAPFLVNFKKKMSKRSLEEMASKTSTTKSQQADELEESGTSSTIPTKSRRMVRRKKDINSSSSSLSTLDSKTVSSIPMPSSSLTSTTHPSTTSSDEKESSLTPSSSTNANTINHSTTTVFQTNPTTTLQNSSSTPHTTRNRKMSEKEISSLDQNFGRLFYAFNLLYRRGFTDFSVAALNEKCGETGERFTLELLQTIQCIVPELFTLYYNYQQQLCLELREDFENRKSVIIGLWKKRLSNPELIDCKKPPVIEKRTLGLNESNLSKQIVSQESTSMLPPPPRQQQQEQKKQTLSEMLKENDRREIEELARQHWLTKKFEIDRACETLLLLFT